MKKTIITLTIYLLFATPSFADEIWMQFECFKGPKYNANGEVLPTDTQNVFYSNNRGKLVFGGYSSELTILISNSLFSL